MFLGEPAYKSNFLFTLLACVFLAWRVAARSRGRFHFQIAARWLRCTCSGAACGRVRVSMPRRARQRRLCSGTSPFEARFAVLGAGGCPSRAAAAPPAWLVCGGKAAGRILQPPRWDGRPAGSDPLILQERVAELRRWLPALPRHRSVLRVPLGVIKQQMHLLGVLPPGRHKLLDPSRGLGLPSRPVPALAAAVALARLGKS